MLTQSSEDYLKVIYNLHERKKVTTNDIAAEMKVAPSSVTKMVKRLSEMGYVEHESHKGVKLTESGMRASLKIIRKHRLLELFLVEVLNYNWDEVHQEACNLEHHISEKFEASINSLLGNPTKDPHGEPIPNEKGVMPELEAVSLEFAATGREVKINWIQNDNPELLKYLENLGILPGKKVKIIDKQPYGGPIILRIGAENKLLGVEAARNVFVSR